MSDSTLHKTKITTPRGTFEFEGTRDFVEAQIKFVLEIMTKDGVPSESAPNKPVPRANEETQAKPKAASRKASIEQPRIIPNFLTDAEKIKSLRSFYSEKRPETHIDIYAVITYWLKHNISMEEVSINEMWTLYKILAVKPPRTLIQVFRDGKSKKVYFEAGSSSGYYFITSIGETYVEHDLPKQASST